MYESACLARHFLYLKEKSWLLQIKPENMTEARDQSVKWIFAIGAKFRYGLDTISLDVTLLDTALSRVQIKDKYVNCCALAALYLAMKVCEEMELIPNTGQFIEQVQAEYSVRELNRMERALLSKLGWDLGLPTTYKFVQMMVHTISGDNRIGTFVDAHMRHILETILCSHQLAHLQSPSTLALAALSIIFEKYSRCQWLALTDSLQQQFRVEKFELIACRERLYSILQMDDKENVQHKVNDAGNQDKQHSLHSQIHLAIENAKQNGRKRHRLSSGAGPHKISHSDEQNYYGHEDLADALHVLYGIQQ